MSDSHTNNIEEENQNSFENTPVSTATNNRRGINLSFSTIGSFINKIQSFFTNLFTRARNIIYWVLQRRKCPYCMATIINSNNGRCSNTPSCGKQLPTDFFKYKSRIIALVGGPDAGKSTYITILTHQLLSNSSILEMLNLHASITDSIAKDYFEINEEQLLIRKEKLEVTQPSGTPPPPIVIKLVKAGVGKQKKVVFLTLYDTPGDEFSKPDKLEQYHPHISNADAILYLTDPLNIRGIHKELSLARREELEKGVGGFQIDFEIIDNLYTVFVRDKKAKKNKIQIPISFCISKIDILDDIATIYIPEDIDSELLQLKDIFEEIKYTSDDLYDFLMEKDGRLVRNLEVQFNAFEFFPVAPIGQNIDTSGTFTDDISPKGILHPLLWILHQLKFV